MKKYNIDTDNVSIFRKILAFPFYLILWFSAVIMLIPSIPLTLILYNKFPWEIKEK